MSDESKQQHTALETWIIGAVEAGMPEGTIEQKLRIGILLLQSRAQEQRNFSTMLMMNNPRNMSIREVYQIMVDREHRLEEIALKWANGSWPPEAGSTKDTVGEPLVRLN